MRSAGASNSNETPSSRAAAISRAPAGMVSALWRDTTVTASAPQRSAVRAASMAVMPSPTTSTEPDRLWPLPLPLLPEEVDGVQAADSRCSARNRRRGLRGRGLGPGAQHHRVEAGLEQALRVALEMHLRIAHEADAGVPEGLQLGVEDRRRQAELGDEVAQRAAGLRRGVVDRHLMPAGCEEPGRRKAGRPSAHDGYPLAAW